jgi:hypothetical protein
MNLSVCEDPTVGKVVLCSERPTNVPYHKLALTCPQIDTGPPETHIWSEEDAEKIINEAKLDVSEKFDDVLEFALAARQIIGGKLHVKTLQCECGRHIVVPTTPTYQVIHGRGWSTCMCGQEPCTIDYDYAADGRVYSGKMGKLNLQPVSHNGVLEDTSELARFKLVVTGNYDMLYEHMNLPNGPSIGVNFYSNGGRTLLERAWPDVFVTHGHARTGVADWWNLEWMTQQALANKNVVILYGQDGPGTIGPVGLNHKSKRSWQPGVSEGGAEPPTGTMTASGLQKAARNWAASIGRELNMTFSTCAVCGSKQKICDELRSTVTGWKCHACKVDIVVEVHNNQPNQESTGMVPVMYPNPAVQTLPYDHITNNSATDTPDYGKHSPATRETNSCTHSEYAQTAVINGYEVHTSPQGCMHRCNYVKSGLRCTKGTAPHGMRERLSDLDTTPHWIPELKKKLTDLSKTIGANTIVSVAGQACKSRNYQIIWVYNDVVEILRQNYHGTTIGVPVQSGRELASARLLATYIPNVTVILANGRGEPPKTLGHTTWMAQHMTNNMINDCVDLPPTNACCKSAILQPNSTEIGDLACKTWYASSTYGHDEWVLYQFRDKTCRLGRYHASLVNMSTSVRLPKTFGFWSATTTSNERSDYCCHIIYNTDGNLSVLDLVAINVARGGTVHIKQCGKHIQINGVPMVHLPGSVVAGTFERTYINIGGNILFC